MSMDTRNSGHSTATLLKKIHDQERHMEFLHRQQRDVRFLAKQLVIELKVRLNRRANAIVSRHLAYRQDENVKSLISNDSLSNTLAQVRELDVQNIRLQNISLSNRLKPLFWRIIASCFNFSIRISKGLVRHVR